MKFILSAVAACLAAQIGLASAADNATAVPLISKDLAEFQGKEGTLLEVNYAPGGTDAVHRHNAHAFIYVLEGTITMQLKGGPEVTLTPGQTFYEGPNDVHLIGRNASTTEPARFLAFFIKDKTAPILVPAE